MENKLNHRSKKIMPCGLMFRAQLQVLQNELTELQIGNFFLIR